MVRYRAPRRKVKIGPFYMWFSGVIPRFTSMGVEWGRFGHNITRGTSRLDTPGPGWFSHKWGNKKDRQ